MKKTRKQKSSTTGNKRPASKVSEQRLLRLLRGKCRTARALAEVLGCSRIHTYRLIKRLQAGGVLLNYTHVRDNPTGPLALAYQLAP